MEWEKFENNVCLYLIHNLIFPGLVVKQAGGSNSTVSDIELIINNEKTLVLECKFTPSQAGQFVLVTDSINKKFIISEKNKSIEATEEIVKHMNKNYDHYQSDSKNGKKLSVLICEKKLMYKRVIAQMKSKSSFVASSFYSSYFSDERPLLICSIDSIEKYFEISGVYRAKKSGSSSLPKKDYQIFKNKFKTIESGNKIFISDNKIPSNYKKSYWFSKPDDMGKREVRKLSKTANGTVIFTLKLKKKIIHTDLSEIYSALEVG